MLGASLLFHQDEKLIWLAALGGLAVLALIISYARFPQRGPWKFCAVGLKFLGIALLIFCALEPMLVREEPKKGANIFLVVADGSESLQIRNHEAEQSRGEDLRDDLIEADESGWIKSLKDEFKVHQYSFGERLQRLNDFSSLSFEDRSSSFFGTLKEIEQRYTDRPLAGIFVLTDGNFHDVEENLSLIPKGIPIYPVNVATEAPERDTSVRQVVLTQSVFEDAPLTVSADIDLFQVANRSIEVAVLDENDRKVATETISTDLEIDQKAVSFQLKPENDQRIAPYRITVTQLPTSDPDDAIKEATTKNNLRYLIATLPQGPYPILYVSGRPDWEFKFFRRAMSEDNEIQLAALLRMAKREPKFAFKGREGESSNPLFRGFGAQDDTQDYDQPVIIAIKPNEEFSLGSEFPKIDEDLFQFSAIILDNVEAEFFTFEQQERLEQFVSRRGGGLVMLGGKESFRKGAYERTPIGELLPAYLDRVPFTPGIGEQDLELSREGWLEPWTRLRTDRASEEDRLAELPGFKVVSPVGGIKPGASVLAHFRDRQGNEHPAIISQSYGKGRSVALTIGDIWRWGFRNPDKPEQKEDMNKFWRQLMRWIVTDTPQPVSLRATTDSSRFPPRVNLAVSVNTNTYHPDNSAQVELEITDPAGETFPLRAALSTDEAGTYVASYTAVKEGFYQAKATVTDRQNEPVGEAVHGWAVNPSQKEFQDLSGNDVILAKLASATKGEVIEQADLASFVRDLSKKPLPVMETKTSPIWHLPVFFLLALLCFAGEWALKRWKGLP